MAKRVKSLKKGEDLFLEGDTPDAMYIINKGRLAIVKRKGKANITLAELKPGDLLGEMAFFDKAPRSAGAKAAMDNTEVIELPFAALEQQWAALPSWVKSIVKAVNGHLRRANIRIRQLEKTQEEEKEVFSSHNITALMSILGFVTSRYGEECEEGLQVHAGKLRNYTIQVFQKPTHKMNLLCETLEQFDHMMVENLGEGKLRFVVKNLDFIFNFIEFYNNILFNEAAKKMVIQEHQLKTLKVAKFYGTKTEKNTKGFVKLNVTDIAKTAMSDVGCKINVDDIKDLDHTGLLGDLSSDGENDYIEFDVDYVAEIVPFWELIYKLKSYQQD